MDENSLEDALDSFTEGGEVKDKGQFTLSPTEALASMKKYLLAEPRSYVLNLLASAVLSEASHTSFSKDSDDLIFTHNGRSPKFSELENLFLSTLNHKAPPQLRELAVGLYAALSIQPKWIRLEADGCRLTLAGEEHSLEPAPELDGGALKVHVKEPLSLSGFFQASHEEEEYLKARGRYAPLKLELNGFDVTRGWVPRQAVAGAFIAGTQVVLPSQAQQGFELPLVTLEEEQFGGLLYFSSRRDLAYAPLRIVLNGILYELPEESLGWEGAAAVIFTNQLQKDISQDGLVRNEAFLKLLKSVREHLGRLSEEVAENWWSLSDDTRRRRLDILEQRVEKTDRSERIAPLRTLVETFQTEQGPESPETRRYRRRLGTELREVGECEEAASLLLEEAALSRAEGHLNRHAELLEAVLSMEQQGLALGPDKRLDALRALALSLARLGEEKRAEEALERLALLYRELPGGEEKLAQFRLEFEMTQEEKVTLKSQCVACGSERLMTDCPLTSEGNYVYVRLGEPTSTVFRSELDAPLFTTVCGDCGHVSLKVKNPTELWNRIR